MSAHNSAIRVKSNNFRGLLCTWQVVCVQQHCHMVQNKWVINKNNHIIIESVKHFCVPCNISSPHRVSEAFRVTQFSLVQSQIPIRAILPLTPMLSFPQLTGGIMFAPLWRFSVLLQLSLVHGTTPFLMPTSSPMLASPQHRKAQPILLSSGNVLIFLKGMRSVHSWNVIGLHLDFNLIITTSRLALFVLFI